MTYSIENIKSYKKSNEDNINYISFSESCINLLEESDNELRLILLSCRDNVVKEASLSENGLIKVIKSIIKFFIKTIKDIFGRFYAIILRFLDNDETIKKYKNQLHSLPSSFNLSKYSDIEYYNYTYLDADIPDPNLYLLFTNYEDSLTELKKLSKNVSKQELLSSINDIANNTDTMSNGEYFNRLRSIIINKGNDNKVVSAETYQSKLFSLFRGGAVDNGIVGKQKIGSEQVALSCDRYLKYKDLVKKTEKQRDTIERVAKETEEKFINAIKNSMTDHSADDEVIYALDMYEKKKVAQLAEMCNICVMAFSAKITALKECAIMDKKICYKAITHILTGDLED